VYTHDTTVTSGLMYSIFPAVPPKGRLKGKSKATADIGL
jgi:hypothetical protein